MMDGNDGDDVDMTVMETCDMMVVLCAPFFCFCFAESRLQNDRKKGPAENPNPLLRPPVCESFQ